MKTSLLKTLIAIITLDIATASFAHNRKIYVLKNYQAINQLLTKQQLFNHKTLVVFDNDDTLTKLPCNIKGRKICSIGSSSWELWQHQLLNKKTKSALPPAARSIKGIFAISNLIRNISNSPLIEPKSERALLAKLAHHNDYLIIATARQPTVVGATHRQLSHQHLSSYFSQHGLRYKNISSLPYPWSLSKLKLPVRYEQGVLFLSGQNKGYAIRAMLSQTTAKLNNIVFIDDDMKNVQNFSRAFDHTSYHVYCIHYTQLEKSKMYISQNHTDQRLLHAQWNRLHQAIVKAISQPMLT